MPTYIMLSTLTAQGVQTLKANPDRLREVNRDVEELGAKVVHQWATLGPFDFVNVVEAPDAATIARVSVRRCARAGTRARTASRPGRERLGRTPPPTPPRRAARRRSLRRGRELAVARRRRAPSARP